ncbi:MAG: helix-turn-helix domain-containing protein [Bacteroidales bacterium]|jgi:transcriptional regulator with XRE-family HTH domain|nr:helix-turn-helix domain-containing protein [Bacteroidales bacterium]
MLFAEKIKHLREEKQLLQRQLAAILEIDTPMYSKIERGDRRAKREQIPIIAEFLQTDEKELLSFWLADQVTEVVENDKDMSETVLNIAKQKLNE